MEKQFELLGKGADSRGLAVHLLSATQGVSVLAHTFQDPNLIVTEAERLKEWIRVLGFQASTSSFGGSWS
jgi:hypothetical protein